MAAIANKSRTCPAWCAIHDGDVCLGVPVIIEVTDREPYMAHALSVSLGQCPEDGLSVGLAINHVGPHEVTLAAAKAFALAILAQVELAEAGAAAIIPGPRTSADDSKAGAR